MIDEVQVVVVVVHANSEVGETTWCLLVRDEDFERLDNLYQRNTLVCRPLLGSICIINKDDKFVFFTFEMNLGLLCFAPSHDCCPWKRFRTRAIDSVEN